MRQRVSTALVALVIGALAGSGIAVLAQAPGEVVPEQEAITPAGLNADKVDGRHAVKATANKRRRARKLVATGADGFLPSNIVKPKWALIQNKPPALVDGQIAWNEVVGIPGDFADGLDDRGVAGVALTRVSVNDTFTGAQNETGYLNANCPPGSKVVGGGFTHNIVGLDVRTSAPFNDSSWTVNFRWREAGTGLVAAFAICMSTDPAGSIVTARRGKLPARLQP